MTSTHGDHPKGLRFSHGSASVVGQVRAANEDSFVVTDRLVAVADGMGGHAAGEVASAIAVEVVAGAAEAHDVEVVTNAVVTANAQILERAMQDSSERGMGTTLCVAAIVADRGAEGIAILNVGDSRIYLLADDTLHQLTEDHSLVETLVREGRITPAEAAVHPQRNVLTRALGVDQGAIVDAWMLEPASGDRLLLCSDGLFNELDFDTIESILIDAESPQAAVDVLTEQADAAGGRDNITAVVADLIGADSEPGELGSRLRWLGTSSGTIDDGDPRTETASIPIVPSDARPSDDSEGSGDSGTDAESEAADDAGPFGEAETEESTIDGDTDDGDTDNIDNSDNSASDAAPAPRQEDLSEADGIESDQVEASPSDAIVAKGSRWRTAAFIGALVLIVAAGLTAAATYFRDGWTVAASGQQIVIHKGRVSSVPLLNSSKAHVASDLTLKDLTESSRDKVLSGQHYNSESDARNFINNLQTTTTTASTTTTAPATTTSTIATTSTSPTATDSIVSNTTAPLDPTATTVPG